MRNFGALVAYPVAVVAVAGAVSSKCVCERDERSTVCVDRVRRRNLSRSLVCFF